MPIKEFLHIVSPSKFCSFDYPEESWQPNLCETVSSSINGCSSFGCGAVALLSLLEVYISVYTSNQLLLLFLFNLVSGLDVSLLNPSMIIFMVSEKVLPNLSIIFPQ